MVLVGVVFNTCSENSINSIHPLQHITVAITQTEAVQVPEHMQSHYLLSRWMEDTFCRYWTSAVPPAYPMV